MGAYILRRLLLMIPTIFGIMAISFAVVQFAPGGPVERVIAQLSGQGGDALDRLSGGGGDFGQSAVDSGSVNSNIAARGGWTRNSSPIWKSSSVSTNRRWSVSARCYGTICDSISVAAISAISA